MASVLQAVTDMTSGCLTAHRHSLTNAHSHTEPVKMTTVKEVGLHRTTESTASRRRPLVMTPSMEEAEEDTNL